MDTPVLFRSDPGLSSTGSFVDVVSRTDVDVVSRTDMDVSRDLTPIRKIQQSLTPFPDREVYRRGRQ